MARKPARSKAPNDAHVKIADAQTPAPTISGFHKLLPQFKRAAVERTKKSLERLRLSATSKQALRDYFQPQLAGLREEDLSRIRSGVALAFSDLVTNTDPGVIASLAAKLTIDWPPGTSFHLAPDRLLIEILLTDRKSRVATARTYIGDHNLALLVMHDPTPVWKALAAEYGTVRLLTLVALDSLDTMSIQESTFLIKVMTDCAVEHVNAQNTQRAKRLEPLNKYRAEGARANKEHAAEAHARLRQIAWDLYERDPTCGMKDAVQHILHLQTAGEIQGRTYSAVTIRRHIKGVHEEWRKDFDARRRKTGLYRLD